MLNKSNFSTNLSCIQKFGSNLNLDSLDKHCYSAPTNGRWPMPLPGAAMLCWRLAWSPLSYLLACPCLTSWHPHPKGARALPSLLLFHRRHCSFCLPPWPCVTNRIHLAPPTSAPLFASSAPQHPLTSSQPPNTLSSRRTRPWAGFPS
jgi:hypothetical protein